MYLESQFIKKSKNKKLTITTYLKIYLSTNQLFYHIHIY